MAEQSERDILQDQLIGIDELVIETLKNRRELRELETESTKLYDQGQISILRYEIEKQRIRRAHKNVDFCLKNLQRQKNLALWKLRTLE